MTVPEYTIVVGVDRKHLRQLSWVWPTWRKFKPSLLKHPMIVFFDRHQVTESEVTQVVDHPNLAAVSWPIGNDYDYRLSDGGKWTSSQRYKMLAGFVHVPAVGVETEYWLKLDTDTVASGMDDWIAPSWFDSGPAIVSHPWSFTKPADQMLRFDAWVHRNPVSLSELWNRPPLNLIPKPGWSRVRHKRIISWCAFFQADFTVRCAEWADAVCGRNRLPQPTQDGYFWYVATRLGLPIVRAGMKSRGWVHRTSERGIRSKVEEVMNAQ